MGFKVGVKEREHSTPVCNQQVFGSEAEADAAGKELLSRWLMPHSFEVIEKPTEEPNSRWDFTNNRSVWLPTRAPEEFHFKRS